MNLRLPDHLHAKSQAGFGIIEVLVSAILVVLVATGVFAAFDTATRASGANKARSVASNVARGDQEQLRGKTADELTTLPPTRTEKVDGKTFTVASSTEWVADRTGTPSCTTADGRADYLKLRSSVTWTGMGVIEPVVMESLRAIPRGEFRPNQGTIAVKVTDRNGAGVPGISVNITGTRAYTGTTNSLGCLLYDQVPVGPYSASITATGYVTDVNPNNAVVTQAFTVAKEQTSSVPVTLDRAGTARVAFVRNNTITGTTGDGFTVANTGLGAPAFRPFLLPTATGKQGTLYSGAGSVALTSSATRGLFPFPSAYQVWAGACAEADPRNYSQPVVTQTIAPGALAASVSVNLPRMTFSFKQSTGSMAGYRYVLKPVGSGCTRTVTASSTSATATATPTPDLPYGDYRVCMQIGNSTTAVSGVRSATQTFQNRVATGTTHATVTLPDAPNGGSCPA